MGYRSDVTILIYGDKDEVTAFVAGEKLKGKPKDLDYHPLSEPKSESHESDVYDFEDKQDKTTSTSTMMRWIWWDVKWYEGFSDVEYWQNLEAVFDDAFEGTSLCMEVAVVGESVDDNVTNYYGNSPEYYLNISRAIEDSSPNKEIEDGNSNS